MFVLARPTWRHRKRRRGSMPSYVTLLNWTEQGVRNFKDTVDRFEAAQSRLEALGVRVTEIRWTPRTHHPGGPRAARDDEALAAGLLAVAGEGNIRSTTLRAFSRDEMRG